MALGSTQPLTEMSTGSISWHKGGRCVRLTTLSPSCAVVTKSGNLNFLNSLGHSSPVMGLLYFFLFLPEGPLGYYYYYYYYYYRYYYYYYYYYYLLQLNFHSVAVRNM